MRIKVKIKMISFFRMFSKEDAEKIRNYGRLSYDNGYKDGYGHGMVMGGVFVISGVAIGICLSKYLKV
jgi:hypothetical protein